MTGPEHIIYSARYNDKVFEYRYVTLPEQLAALLDGRTLLAEHEWRSLGIQQTRGWIHYGYHPPEQHILLFRRPLARTQAPQPAAPQAMQQQQKALISSLLLKSKHSIVVQTHKQKHQSQLQQQQHAAFDDLLFNLQVSLGTSTPSIMSLGQAKVMSRESSVEKVHTHSSTSSPSSSSFSNAVQASKTLSPPKHPTPESTTTQDTTEPERKIQEFDALFNENTLKANARGHTISSKHLKAFRSELALPYRNPYVKLGSGARAKTHSKSHPVSYSPENYLTFSRVMSYHHEDSHSLSSSSSSSSSSS